MITVYSKENCPQCLQAESLLKMKKFEYQVKKLDVDYTREDIAAIFDKAEKPQPRAFPIILKGEEIVGDLTALKMAVARGTL